MKKAIYILFVILYSSQFALGQEYQIIQLNDVDLAKTQINEEAYPEALSKRIKRTSTFFNQAKSTDSIIFTNLHPFVAAAHMSFATHRPLVISPDMIWLLINQSFAIHINENPEKYRRYFVDFENKKEINLINNSFEYDNPNNNWEHIISLFGDSIKAHIKDSLYNMTSPNFSTTGKDEKIAYTVSLMNSTSNYFDYNFFTFCGIPYIRLEGKPQDWKWILDKIETFNYFDLKFWTEKLKPIIQEFYNSSRGNHNTEFWNNYYKWYNDSANNSVTGWITYFFLYTSSKEGYKINNIVLSQNDSHLLHTGLKGNHFPSGISEVDFKWLYLTDTLNMTFHAGFVGISQNKNSLELKPEISYVISNKKDSIASKTEMTIIDREYKTCNTYSYNKEQLNQFPTFKNDENTSISDIEFEILTILKSTFPEIKGIICIETTISKDGNWEINKTSIVSKSEKHNKRTYNKITKFLQKFILKYPDWKPAVINGQKSDYKLNFEFYQ